MPKELVMKGFSRPQTPCEPNQNGEADPVEGCNKQANDSLQKPKTERTKSILKQTSKDTDAGDTPSPKKENITFATAAESHVKLTDCVYNKETTNAFHNMEVDHETQCDVRKNSCTQNVGVGTEAVCLEMIVLDKQTGQ